VIKAEVFLEQFVLDVDRISERVAGKLHLQPAIGGACGDILTEIGVAEPVGRHDKILVGV